MLFCLLSHYQDRHSQPRLRSLSRLQCPVACALPTGSTDRHLHFASCHTDGARLSAATLICMILILWSERWEDEGTEEPGRGCRCKDAILGRTRISFCPKCTLSRRCVHIKRRHSLPCSVCGCGDGGGGCHPMDGRGERVGDVSDAAKRWGKMRRERGSQALFRQRWKWFWSRFSFVLVLAVPAFNYCGSRR